MSLVRGLLESKFVRNQKSIDRPKRQLLLDLSLFAFAAVVIVCTQFALKNVDCQDTHNNQLNEQTVPIAHRLNIFLSVTVLIVAVGMGLSAYTYMSLDTSAIKASSVDIRESFIIDTLFILGIIVALATRIIFSYSINVQRLFEHQMDVLRRVEQGDLDRYVPVLTIE
ncbi:MAG: hypothetical protein AMJ55_03525 [Gammaproteobacteria bacterium SG8_15]|nr:MAG: hypothetical protein AMJ55_03525 [Gammaproteobacteria bacterium SG8_15]